MSDKPRISYFTSEMSSIHQAKPLGWTENSARIEHHDVVYAADHAAYRFPRSVLHFFAKKNPIRHC